MIIKSFVAVPVLLATIDDPAQTGRKKLRSSLSSTTVTLLPTFAAHDKGFFRDEGLDVEVIHMPATLASTKL